MLPGQLLLSDDIEVIDFVDHREARTGLRLRSENEKRVLWQAVTIFRHQESDGDAEWLATPCFYVFSLLCIIIIQLSHLWVYCDVIKLGIKTSKIQSVRCWARFGRCSCSDGRTCHQMGRTFSAKFSKRGKQTNWLQVLSSTIAVNHLFEQGQLYFVQHLFNRGSINRSSPYFINAACSWERSCMSLKATLAYQ